jgi:hypothetical protein
MIAHRKSVILIFGCPIRFSCAMSDVDAAPADSDRRKALRVEVVISTVSAPSFYNVQARAGNAF